MDFDLSQRQCELQARVRAFMADHVLPAVPVYQQELEIERWRQPAVLQTLKAKARAAGLWNLFLPPSPEHDHGELPAPASPISSTRRWPSSWGA